MSQAILLTGRPGCGKTTVIQRVVARLERPAFGFYTQEIRQGGHRVGFEIVTLDGQRGVLAHVGIRSQVRLGKYGLDLAALDELAVGAIESALQTHALAVIDEIGPMEIASPRFRDAVLRALESPAPVLGTIAHKNTPFLAALKRRPQVTLVEVTSQNRDALPDRILGWLSSVEAHPAGP